jgi:hypothetical protein
MLLCDIAWLSRLSITIFSLTGLLYADLTKLNNFVSSRFDEAELYHSER